MREFGKIKTSVWKSKKFKSVSIALSKVLYLYLHTNTHGNSIGCYWLSKEYAISDLALSDVSIEAIDRAIEELSKSNLIKWDEDEEIIYLCDFLLHSPITNRKHAIGAAKAALLLPKSPLREAVCEDILTACIEVKDKTESPSTHEQISEMLRDIRKPPDTPIETPIDITETETETETETTLQDAGASEVGDVGFKPVEIIKSYDRLIIEVYGSEQLERPYAAPTDLPVAASFQEQGASLELCEQVFQGILEYRKSKGEAVPNSLKYFTKPIAKALEDGTIPGADKFLLSDAELEREQWKARLTGYFERDMWLGTWGENPDSPGCMAPKELISELRPIAAAMPDLPADLDRRDSANA